MEWGMSQAMHPREHFHRVLPTNQVYGFNHHQGPKIIELAFQKHAKVAVSFRLKLSNFFSYSYVESNQQSR